MNEPHAYAQEESLGDRLKQQEGVEALRRCELGQVLIARLDGRAFHTFTKGLRRPYDERLSKLMIDTTKHLVNQLHPLVGYTQSDEISLVWYLPADTESQYPFSGRYQKITSIAAAIATSFFNLKLLNEIPERSATWPLEKARIPVFDARAWSVSSLDDAYLTLLWRERDAVKNSITMLALQHFSHQELNGVPGESKLRLLSQKGVEWINQPEFFKRGTYVRRVQVERALSAEELEAIPADFRPDGPVLRSELIELNLPLLVAGNTLRRTEAFKALFE